MSTITSKELCELTGLTDRRHRQLAEQGLFPMPVRGEYQLLPTFKGLLTYYRNQAEEEETDLEKEKTRLTKAQADIAEVERARVRNEVIETQTVFNVWENIAVSIRRTILTSALSDAEKDSILNELRSLKIEDFLEQREFDQGTAAEVS